MHVCTVHVCVCMRDAELTINNDNLYHGNGKEWYGINRQFNHDGSHTKHHQDGYETTQNPYVLRNSGKIVRSKVRTDATAQLAHFIRNMPVDPQ